MATTKFNGPVNSVNGFQVNGTNYTFAAGSKVTNQTLTGSLICVGSDFGLSTVTKGWAFHNSVVHGASYIYTSVLTSVEGAVGSGSFQLNMRTSGDATVSEASGKWEKAATIDILLLGTV